MGIVKITEIFGKTQKQRKTEQNVLRVNAPIGSFSKSIRTVPARAQAMTNGGEAR